MKVIYADTLFIINFIFNYLILLTTAKICDIDMKRLRMMICSAFGGVYAVLSVFPWGEFLNFVPVKLAAGILMAVSSFGKEHKLLRVILVFFTVSAAYGGVLFAMTLFGYGDITNGTVYIPISFKALFITFFIAYGIISLIFSRAARCSKDGGGCVSVQVFNEGKNVTFTALRDTGNSLSDPITGKKVIVTDMEKLIPLFSYEQGIIIRKLKNTQAVEVLIKLEGRSPKGMFRLVPYSAVGIGDGMLLAFKPESVLVDRKQESLIIAFSPTSVSDGGAYSALIGV